MRHFWPTWEVSAACQMWRAGKSASIIAQRLETGRTRQAVLGKLAKVGELGNEGRRTLEILPCPHPPRRVYRPRKVLPACPMATDVRRCPHWRDVADAVVEASGVSMVEIRSKARTNRVVAARQALMWLMRKYCRNASSPIIGSRINRDHTTVMWGIRRVNNLLTGTAEATNTKEKSLEYIIAYVKKQIGQNGDHGTDQD